MFVFVYKKKKLRKLQFSFTKLDYAMGAWSSTLPNFTARLNWLFAQRVFILQIYIWELMFG